MSLIQADKWTLRLLTAGTMAVAVAVLGPSPSVASDQTGKMDKKALTVLNEMSDYLGKSKTVSFRVRSFFDVVEKSGIKIKTGRLSTVLIRRPNDLYILSDGDDGSGASIWFDGSKLTIWKRNVDQVMSHDFAGSTDQMLNHLLDEYDVQVPLGDLLYSNISKSFKGDILSAEYLGIRIVDGVKCHHLSFESDGADWQIWIEADETPVPRRFVVDFVNDDNKPQYMAQMDAWSIGGEIKDYNFVAAVPKSVKRVEFKFK